MTRVSGKAACLGVLTVLAALIATSPAAAAVDPLEAEAKDVTIQDETVTFVVTVDGLPEGAQLDPAAVSLTVAGRSWPVAAQAVGGSVSPVSRTAMLVVDTSGSMGAAGIADAQAASQRFLSVVPPDVAVGLVTFADQAQLVVAPTKDRTAVQTGLAQMRPAGNTRLYDGIELALQSLGSDGERALIVLSDGKDTASTASLQQISDRLASSGVNADLVAFRTPSGQVDVLTELARRTGGRVSEASTGGQLADVFATAARTLVNQVSVTAQIPPGTTAGALDAVIDVSAGSRTAVASFQLEVPATAVPAGGLAGTAGAARPIVTARVPWLLPAVVLVFFLGLFALLTLALSPATWGRNRSVLRSKEMQRYGLAGVGLHKAPDQSAVGSASQVALGWADRAVQARGLESSWSTALDRAGMPLRPKEWLIIRLGVALVAAALTVLLLPFWLVTAPLLGVLGWLLAGGYVRLKGNKRLKAFADGLPDVLQLVAGSLRSGFSLPQAVDNAAKDGQEPLAGEFARALAESRLGVPLEDALDRVAERMNSTDLTWTVMAIRIAREVGGNLAEVLLSTAETMRERGRIQRQVRVLSAEGRLSAYVLIALPLGILAFMVAFRGSYIAPLVTDPIGWVMSFYGVLSVLVGTWWMSRLVKLEV